MKNNNSITSSYEKREESIDKDESLEPLPECCIYKVPKRLRKINEEAYTPQVISIGPLHHGKEELIDMGKQKIRYKREFRKRITMEETWQELITFIENKEIDIRKCYEKMPEIQRSDFISMILYDAIFVIELFLRNYENIWEMDVDKKENDFLLKRQVGYAIRVDLELLENQLPYFILKELYMLASPKIICSGPINPSFFSLSCIFFWDSMFKGVPEEIEVKHFVDLRRYVLTKPFPKLSSAKEPPKGTVDIPCAVKLKESGLKFKGINEHGELLEIKFEKKKLRIPCLQVHYTELQIPLIKVYDGTEVLIRNVMAFEQCHYPHQTHVCNYIELLDDLINTEEDVNLLVEAGIIYNGVGDNATVANMFNKLCKHISLSSPSSFHGIRRDLNAHYKDGWNHTMATLKSVYFSNYWRGTGTVAAIVLLLLTLIQTICSILQLV